MSEIDLQYILAVFAHDHIHHAAKERQSFSPSMVVDHIHGHQYVDRKLQYWVVMTNEPGVCYLTEPDYEVDASTVRQYTKLLKRKTPLPSRLPRRGRRPQLVFSPFDPAFTGI